MSQVRQLQGDPLALSYWLASNLPLEDDTRQRLLEAPTVVERSVHRLCNALYCTFGTAVHNSATAVLHYTFTSMLRCISLHLLCCSASRYTFCIAPWSMHSRLTLMLTCVWPSELQCCPPAMRCKHVICMLCCAIAYTHSQEVASPLVHQAAWLRQKVACHQLTANMGIWLEKAWQASCKYTHHNLEGYSGLAG